MSHLSQMRTNYSKSEINPDYMNPNPLLQIQKWLNDAIESKQPEPGSMTLATIDATGSPRSRVVLLKEISDKGLQFFTSYESDKGKEISHSSKVSVLLFWPLLERQIRIEGDAIKLPESISDQYFASRPRESQLGAWASTQSQPIASYDELQNRYEKIRQKFKNKAIPRPPHWGGYEITPLVVEFWQGRPGRLHHRYRYKHSSLGWSTQMLAP